MLKEYFKPQTIKEAISLKQQYPEALFLAGGAEIASRQDLHPPYLIDLSRLPLKGIATNAGMLEIGALTTLQEILEAPALEQPALQPLARALARISNRNLRNQATLGGNIATDKSCSDLIPLLLVYKTSIKTFDQEGKSNWAPLETYRLSEDKPLIGALKFRIPDEHTCIDSRRFTRSANDLAIVQVALGFKRKQGCFRYVRLALGGVAAGVITLPDAEEFLEKKPLFSLPLAELLAVVQKNIQPIDDVRASADYKRKLVNALITEILVAALGKEGVH